jgi:hypothetical protein
MSHREACGDELRLSWSARGLAYVLGRHGLAVLPPIPAPGDQGAAAAAARVELRVVGAEVRQVRWVPAPRPAPGARGG